MSPFRTRGFTLIEAVVVITILVLLAGVLVPIVTSEVAKTHNLRAQVDLKALADAFNRYYAHTGAWPSNRAEMPAAPTSEPLIGYPCLFENVHKRSGWAGPYLASGAREKQSWAVAVAAEGKEKARGLIDPWGRPYSVRFYPRNGALGAGGGILFLCAGEDGIEQTTDTAAVDGEALGDDLVQVVTRRL